jgi:hypothetical protein
MMDGYRTDWRNIGGWVDLRLMRSAGLRTPWGNLIVKRWGDRLFHERYGERKSNFRLFGLCVSWVRLRHFASIDQPLEPHPAPLPVPDTRPFHQQILGFRLW